MTKSPAAMKALLFDFDGVIAYTFELCYEINKKLNPVITREEYRNKFLGNINDYKPKKCEKEKSEFDFFAHYTPKLLELKINMDMKNSILELSKSYSLFIISSTNTDPIRKFLKQNQIEHCFKEIYGNDVHKSKIEKIKMVLEKYLLTPSECLFITDTVGDIKEARTCDINSVAVSWGFHSHKTLEQANPLTVVDTISELIGAIKSPIASTLKI